MFFNNGTLQLNQNANHKGINIIAKYFVSNKANKLDSPQKTFLVKLLHLYDEIQNWLTVYRALPEVTDENELAKDFDIYRQIPGMRDELAELDQANPSPASRANSIDGVRVAKPVISQVAPAPLPVSRVSLPKIQETGESEPNAMQKTLQEIERAKANPEIVGRLDELLKKAKPVQVEPTKPQANPQPQNPQIDIDAKLEELKKRVGK